MARGSQPILASERKSDFREAFALATSSLAAREAAASPALPEPRPANPPKPAADDTFPKLVLQHAKLRGDHPSMREKEFGIWQTYSWSEAAAAVRATACGFAALGMRRGDKIAIIGDNRPQFYWSMLAAQSLGAVPVPVYQDAVADEMQFVLDHAETRFAVAENQEQVDKLLGIKDRLPHLEYIIYKDARGLRHYRHDHLLSLDDVQEQGRAFDAAHPGFFLGEVAKGRGSDVSVIAYTSGTTGRPKGVMLSFDNLISAARSTVAFDRLSADDQVLAYLPMAWIGDHLFSYAQAIVAGFAVNCPESSETVMTDLKEIGPSYFFAPPRIFENILTQVMIRMEDAGLLKRHMFGYFMRVARRCGAAILEGKRVSPVDRALYALGNLLVYGPLRNALGLTRVRVAYTAGEAIGPDIFLFFRSLGINLKQLYGQTESSAYGCLQADDDVRSDTAGPPAPGVEMKIAEDGEIMYRSPSVFVGYYKNPEATAATRDVRRLGAYRRCRGVHRGRPSPGRRSSQGCRPPDRRHAVRAEISGEQAQVLPLHQGGGRVRRSARSSSRASSTSISMQSATGPSGAVSPTPAIPTSPVATKCMS